MQQISALQELVGNLNPSQPDNREQAILKLYSVLQYVKHSISLERKLFSSSLETVCEKILTHLGQPQVKMEVQMDVLKETELPESNLT